MQTCLKRFSRTERVKKTVEYLRQHDSPYGAVSESAWCRWWYGQPSLCHKGETLGASCLHSHYTSRLWCSLPWKKRGKAVQVRAQWYQQAMCYGCFRNQSRLIRSTCRKSHGSPHPSQTWLCLMKLLRSSSSPPPPSPSLPSVENSACLVCWTSDRLVNCFDRLCLQPGQSVCDKHPGRHQLIVNCKEPQP